VIDAAGQFVIPALSIAIRTSPPSINEGSVSVSSMVNMAEILNPEDIDIYRDLAGGVTAANILHGSANAIGGQTLVIKLRWASSGEAAFEGALPGIKFRSGRKSQAFPTSVSRPAQALPSDALGVEETIRGAFSEAATTRKPGRPQQALRPPVKKNLIPPRRDLPARTARRRPEGQALRSLALLSEDEILMLLRVGKSSVFKKFARFSMFSKATK